MLQQYDATHGLPNGKGGKCIDDNIDFQLSSASILTSVPRQANALERFFSDVALGAEKFSTPR